MRGGGARDKVNGKKESYVLLTKKLQEIDKSLVFIIELCIRNGAGASKIPM